MFAHILFYAFPCIGVDTLVCYFIRALLSGQTRGSAPTELNLNIIMMLFLKYKILGKCQKKYFNGQARN